MQIYKWVFKPKIITGEKNAENKIYQYVRCRREAVMLLLLSVSHFHWRWRNDGKCGYISPTSMLTVLKLYLCQANSNTTNQELSERRQRLICWFICWSKTGQSWPWSCNVLNSSKLMTLQSKMFGKRHKVTSGRKAPAEAEDGGKSVKVQWPWGAAAHRDFYL